MAVEWQLKLLDLIQRINIIGKEEKHKYRIAFAIGYDTSNYTIIDGKREELVQTVCIVDGKLDDYFNVVSSKTVLASPKAAIKNLWKYAPASLIQEMHEVGNDGN